MSKIKGRNSVSKTGTKPMVSESSLCSSVFKLTFAVEVADSNVWADVNEGLLQQGNDRCIGLKLQYHLYPGQSFDVDILIFDHSAKIWHGSEYCWVRSWQFLERRWIAFSINHVFPVRVVRLQDFVATVVPNYGTGSLGTNAKNDKSFEVYLPPLRFGERRYFGPVLEPGNMQESVKLFVENLIWRAVVEYIPESCFDVTFDVPHVTTDKRHQDAVLDSVRDEALKREIDIEAEVIEVRSSILNSKDRKNSKISQKKNDKEKNKTSVPSKTAKQPSFEIKLSGDSILSGTGRIVQFETIGQPQPDAPKIIALISSNNLPAQDDLPIVFLNVGNLYQIPLNELKALRVTHLYTKWQVGEEVHCSEQQPLKDNINFNDHRAVLIAIELFSEVVASSFLENYFFVEIHGIRSPAPPVEPKLFGYNKHDRDFGFKTPKTVNKDLDFIIAVTRIDARKLAYGINAFIREEYPLFPPTVRVKSLEREGFCTNDINLIRAPTEPDLVLRPDIILQAQMTLEVSMGIVGCKTQHLTHCYSRMFCTIKDSEPTMAILRNITNFNEEIIMTGNRDSLLSGFAIDTGSVVIFYLEGPRDGHILSIWDSTEDFYPKVKPVFSCSNRYSTRMYPELILSSAPFVILKMFVPLNVALACPPIYVRPALPLPTRSAVLKLGNLIARELCSFPKRFQMPTTMELKSFRMELCVATRPSPVVIEDHILDSLDPQQKLNQVSRINWDK